MNCDINISEQPTTIGGHTRLYVGRASELIERLIPHGRTIILTDATIDRLYPDLVRRSEHIIIGSGEANKSLRTVASTYDRLMELGADRSTFLLGIGGGIVTDITGFVAATYMRGLDFGFISTTLLGQVDASIGGKNGVNVAGYKNMVGTFRQPRFVVSDVEMLRTLPLRELRSGMAEAIKSALVGDGELFDYIEEHANPDIFCNYAALQHIVRRSVAVKARIVERDELEGGIRRVLNLGHTLGHAIEKSTREVNHGEAVAMGLSLMAHASVRDGKLDEALAQRIDHLLLRLGFRLEPPVSLHNVIREVKHDKKKSNNMLRIVLPTQIGECCIEERTFEEFEKLFSDYE